MMKENCIERDYTSGLKKPDCNETPEDKILERAALKIYEYVNNLPHVIDPIAAKRFEEMIEACDSIAKEFSGKMKATINYENYSAEIVLECVYVEFQQNEFMETLYKLSTTAKSICFLPLTSGFLKIEINMPYFLLKKEDHSSN